MTRVNVINPELLCDAHLLAEIREITRIPNTIVSGRAKLDEAYSDEYVLGTGHVKMFYNKLGWLRERHLQLIYEAKKRGFKAEDRWPKSVPERLFRGWIPDENAVSVNIQRVLDRMPKNARYYGKVLSFDQYKSMLNGAKEC